MYADSTHASMTFCSQHAAPQQQKGSCVCKLHVLRAARICEAAECHAAARACAAVSLTPQLANLLPNGQDSCYPLATFAKPVAPKTAWLSAALCMVILQVSMQASC